MGGCLSYRLKLVHDKVPTKDDLSYGLKLIRDKVPNVTCFSLDTLKKATNNFSTSVRMDGNSTSYKGTLDDGSKVIVKVYLGFSSSRSNGEKFASIVKIMYGVKHKNVVELIGYCYERCNHWIIVHEFIGDYSLDQLLFSDSRVGDHAVLDWPSRVSICHGITRALEYLHCGISPRVLVLDVRPYNVIIDSSFNPKVIDFDLAVLLEGSEPDHSCPVAGTYGYLDLEYMITDKCSEKTDLYAFGITLLEIISGRHSTAFEQHYEGTSLVDWAWELRESGRIPEIVDPTLTEYSEDEVLRFVIIALACVQVPSELRPSTSEVKLMLSEGYDLSNIVLTRPPRPSQIPADWLWRCDDELSILAQDDVQASEAGGC